MGAISALSPVLTGVYTSNFGKCFVSFFLLFLTFQPTQLVIWELAIYERNLMRFYRLSLFVFFPAFLDTVGFFFARVLGCHWKNCWISVMGPDI